MNEFKEKNIVITGGARGIGKACCLEFAKLGANIIFTYNHSKNEAAQLEEELKSLGVRAWGLQLDVKDYVRCQECAQNVLDKFAKVEVLINNSGITKDRTMLMMSKEDWQEVIDTNLSGVFNVTKAFIGSFMRQKEGNIINISSVGSIIGIPGQINYSASKGGLNSFTRSLAREVAYFNIRVNAIAAGFINTDMVKGLKEEHVKAMLSQTALGRFGSPEEIAQLAIFLAISKSSYITGQIIRIDGGLGM